MVATATEPKGQKIRRGKDPVLQIIVSFGKVSFGDHSASIGIRIPREKLPVEKSVEHFCHRRLTGHMIIARDDQDIDQMSIESIANPEFEVSGVFDVSSISVQNKQYSMTASFSLNGLDRNEFSHLANLRGWLLVDLIQQIPEESRKKDADGQKEFLDGEVLEQHVSVLDKLDKSILTKLQEHGITTIGKLKTMADAGELGAVMKSKAPAIENALFAFLEEHPVVEEDEEKKDGEE